MDSNLDEFDHEERQRPALLTVLCVLTFIGSTWAIFSNIWSYAKAPEMVKMFASSGLANHADSSRLQDSPMQNTHRHQDVFRSKMVFSMSRILTVDSIHKTSAAAVISSICTLFGALFMWRLRSLGFYIYILGIIIGIIVPFYIYGNNFLAAGISSFSNFFGLLFIALYALNIKNLRGGY